MIDLGIVRPGATLRIPFSSFDKDDGSAITMTNFAAADILVYKDGSTTERASTAGFTATTDFDSKTGKHLAIIDLADNTTSGFFAAGSEYLVALDAVTVDGVTVGAWIARFRIGQRAAVLDTTIASLSSQTSFTLASGPAEDDALNGQWAIVHDVASAVQFAWVQVLDYVGSTKTVTLVAAPTFTIASPDNFSLMGPMPLQPATLGRTLAVGTAGQGDSNVTQFGGTNATTSGGRPEVNTTHAAGTAWGSGAITSGALASGALTAIAAAVWNALTSGLTTVGSIGKLLVDNLNTTISSRASQTTADAIETDTQDLQARTPAALVGGRMPSDAIAISGSTAAADAVEANIGNLDAAVSSRLASASYTSPPSAATIAAAVWDYLTSAATTVGSLGKLLVDNVNATISSRLASASYSAPLDAAGTRSALGLGSANLDTQLSTIDDFLDTEVAAILAAVDTEVAAIKAKTDNLPEGIQKNTQLVAFPFFMVDSGDHVTGKTGLTVTAERSLDGAAFAACANGVAEVANGVYKITLAAADLNADTVVLKFTGTGADATIIVIKTES